MTSKNISKKAAGLPPLQTAPPESSLKFQLVSEKSFDTGDSDSLRLNFETNRYVDLLKTEGFTDIEANGLIQLISEVVEDSMRASTTSLVNKVEQKRYLAECLKELQLIKNDVSNLELRDFANMKKSLETIKSEVEASKTGMVTDLNRIHAGARLDMNLEKSRTQMEAGDLQKELKAAEEKIDHQMDKLEARMNTIRTSTKKGTQRFIISVFGLLIAIRLIMHFT